MSLDSLGGRVHGFTRWLGTWVYRVLESYNSQVFGVWKHTRNAASRLCLQVSNLFSSGTKCVDRGHYRTWLYLVAGSMLMHCTEVLFSVSQMLSCLADGCFLLGQCCGPGAGMHTLVQS